MSSPRAEFVAGVTRIAPALLGTVPFGMMIGVASIAAGLPVGPATAMSCVAFAGTAQLATLQLLNAGAPAAVILLTVAIINLRFQMYSAAIAPHFRHLSLPWKCLLGYLLSDNGFALAIVRFNREPNLPHRHWFYLGACVTLWLTWGLGCLAGIFLGAQVPPEWSLDFIIPLIFIGIVAPQINDLAHVAAALTAGVVAVAAAGLPYNLSLIGAALAGIGAGAIVERVRA